MCVPGCEQALRRALSRRGFFAGAAAAGLAASATTPAQARRSFSSVIDLTTEIASGAAREIEPELRELFTKVVERDPREAVKMLEPYPDEFVVKMLELLNPAAH